MGQDRSELERALGKVIEEHGEWSAMSIDLGHDLHTRGESQVDLRLSRIVQMAQDVIRRPLRDLRVIDLACLEGHYGIEFAMHGASVVGVEIRDANIAKARFAKEALGLGNIEFRQDDVRHLSRAGYGGFDLVVCSGILYHLDAPAVFDFLAAMRDVCDDCLIIDTYVAAHPEVSVTYQGRAYSGRYYLEHAPTASPGEKVADLWASIDNVRSFWLTKPSLLNFLMDQGFTSVLECHNPPMPHVTEDRITILAIKGRPAEVRSSPATLRAERPRWQESRAKYHPSQDPRVQLRRRIGRLIPAPLKGPIKATLRAVGFKGMEPASPFAAKR